MVIILTNKQFTGLMNSAYNLGRDGMDAKKYGFWRNKIKDKYKDPCESLAPVGKSKNE